MKLQVIAAAFALAALTGCVTGNTQSVQYATAALPGLSRPATINADIYKPEGPGPFPAVIILHGCGGVSRHYQNWAMTIRSWGYVAVVIDSFGSRGYGRLCDTKDPTVWPKDRISDIIGAAEYLNTQPYVIKKDIGLIGFSHGGWTIMKALQSKYYLKEYGIKGAVAYYPYCNKDDGDIDLPLLILMGADDLWTPTERCRRLQTDHLLKHPELVDMVFYPNTYHAFDEPARVQEVIGRGPGGVVQLQKIGNNPVAMKDAEKRAHAFLDQHLKSKN